MQRIIQNSDYSIRMELSGGDDLAELAGSLNQLLNNMVSQQKEQKKNRDRLEEQVIKLTNELSVAKRELKEAVSDSEEAKQQAMVTVNTKNQFLANMSHEIRTPLNGVLGMTELLLGTSLNDKQRRFADTVRRSAECLLSIVNDILDFSRMESGNLRLEQIDFDLRETVEDVAELLAESAQKKGVELACYIPENLATCVRGDANRLRQVLTNIIGNGIKFTEVGEVLVRVTADKSHNEAGSFLFEITDTGTGIRPDQIEKIFDSFSQADGSTTRKHGGAGLGLTISKELVNLMGGNIRVESQPGKGSRFEFTARFEQRSAKEANDLDDALPIQGLNILSVDDNETNRSILDHQLTSWGVRSNSAECGERALEMLHEAVAKGRPYDVAILDMHMPGMDGLQLAAKIKADPNISNVKLMMLTSAILELESEEMYQAGILQYMSKPARQSQLYNCLIGMVGDNIDRSRKANQANGEESLPPLDARILVAEDNPVNQEVVLNMLDLFGCKADMVENGKLAVEAAANNHYDMVLMDCQMPVMDGYEATAAIRKNEREKSLERHTPIIALTANALEGDRERCLAADMDDYLSKPFKQKQLRLSLERWLLDKPQTESQPAAEKQPEVRENKAELTQINEKALDALRALQRPGRPDILQKVVGLYLDNSPTLLQTLENAIDENMAAEVQVAAHSLKSSSANLGATELAALCKTLENMGRNCSLDGAAEKLAEIQERYELVSQELLFRLPKIA